jgi:hypothetical protein
VRIEGEFGFRVEEAVAALRRSFAPPEWQMSAETRAERTRVRLAGDGAAVEIALDPLPDRVIGPTLRLPRCRLAARIEAPGETAAGLVERLRLALHRGGG